MVNNICSNGIAGLTWLRRERIVRGYWGWRRRHDSGFRFRHEKNHAILGRLERRHRFLVRHVLQVLVALLESKEFSFYTLRSSCPTTLHTTLPTQLDTVEMQFNFIGARLEASFPLFLWLPCLMTDVGLKKLRPITNVGDRLRGGENIFSIFSFEISFHFTFVSW